MCERLLRRVLRGQTVSGQRPRCLVLAPALGWVAEQRAAQAARRIIAIEIRQAGFKIGRTGTKLAGFKIGLVDAKNGNGRVIPNGARAAAQAIVMGQGRTS